MLVRLIPPKYTGYIMCVLPAMMSQPALGWFKVCYGVDKHLSLPSSYGHRLAIDYFRGGERVGESYPSFRCKFGGHSLLLCFWVSLREVVLKLVGRPVGKTAASIHRGATQTSGYVKELKLVWFGDFKIQFGSCILAYGAACLASLL